MSSTTNDTIGAQARSAAAATAALLAAAAAGDRLLARALLEAGVWAEPRDESGRTPLICAAQCGHIATMRVLVEAGAMLDACDGGRRRWPALMHAIDADQATAAVALLEWGADANVGEDSGYNALMMAARRGDPWLVERLLACGADPAGELFLGFTALDYAIGYGHAPVVRLLLGAAPHLKRRRNAARRAVLALAGHAGDEETLALLA